MPMRFHVTYRADDFYKHDADVKTLLFRDGKLYSGADDGKIMVWLPDLEHQTEFRGHGGSAVSIAADDDNLYSCSNDGSLKSFPIKHPEETVIIREKSVQFLKVCCDGGHLFAADNQSNIRIFKKEVHYGDIKVPAPAKDMLITKNLMLTSMDNDITITRLNFKEKKPQSAIVSTLKGRGPMDLVGNRLFYVAIDGKNIVVNEIDEIKGIVKELHTTKQGHTMEINSLVAVDWGNGPQLFSGGLDKSVRKWKVQENGALIMEESCEPGFVVNTLTVGAKGQVYAAGGDGQLARLDFWE